MSVWGTAREVRLFEDIKKLWPGVQKNGGRRVPQVLPPQRSRIIVLLCSILRKLGENDKTYDTLPTLVRGHNFTRMKPELVGHLSRSQMMLAKTNEPLVPIAAPASSRSAGIRCGEQ